MDTLKWIYLSNVMEFLSRFAPQTVVTHVGNRHYLTFLTITILMSVLLTISKIISWIPMLLWILVVFLSTIILLLYSYSIISTTALQATDSQILATAGLHADLGSILTFDPLNPPTSLTRFIVILCFELLWYLPQSQSILRIPTLKLVTALCHLIWLLPHCFTGQPI